MGWWLFWIFVLLAIAGSGGDRRHRADEPRAGDTAAYCADPAHRVYCDGVVSSHLDAETGAK